MAYTLGIDISKWQDDNSTPQMMDFNKSREAGANYVFIKASQAAYLDPDYINNWQHAKDAGLPRGLYHFMDWSLPAITQARFFAGVLKADPGELPPVVDFEARYNNPGKQGATVALYIFINEVEQTIGKRIMIYTGPSYWREFWDGTQTAFFGARDLWIANYYVTKPTIPTPWKTWKFWQYSAKGNGLLFGAESKDLDMDWYNGTAEQFQAEYSLTQPALTIEQKVDILWQEHHPAQA